MSSEEVINWLNCINPALVCIFSCRCMLSGVALEKVTYEQLRDMGVKIGDRRIMLDYIEDSCRIDENTNIAMWATNKACFL